MCFFTLKVSRTSMFLWTCDFTHFVFLIFLLQTRVASGLFVFGPQHGLHRFFPPHVLTEVLRGFPLPPRLPGPRPGEEKRPQTPMPRTFDLRPTVPCDRVTVTPRSGGDQVRFDVKDPRDASRRGDVPRTRPRPRPGTWWLWQEARGSDRPPSMSRVFFFAFLDFFFRRTSAHSEGQERGTRRTEERPTQSRCSKVPLSQHTSIDRRQLRLCAGSRRSRSRSRSGSRTRMGQVYGSNQAKKVRSTGQQRKEQQRTYRPI